MPKFTIETTYDLPVYRHTTYEAESLEAALAMAEADDDWSAGKEDYENGHDTRITGAWAGEEAYRGDQLPVPAEAPLSALPLGLSPLPWKYVNTSGNPVKGMADWIEDAHGNIVVENVGHIDGPFIVSRVNVLHHAGPSSPDYLDRFPAEARVHADRAYQDGFEDGANSARDDA